MASGAVLRNDRDHLTPAKTAFQQPVRGQWPHGGEDAPLLQGASRASEPDQARSVADGGKRSMNLSITHNSRDPRCRTGREFLESLESVVIPYRAPDSRLRGARWRRKIAVWRQVAIDRPTRRSAARRRIGSIARPSTARSRMNVSGGGSGCY